MRLLGRFTVVALVCEVMWSCLPLARAAEKPPVKKPVVVAEKDNGKTVKVSTGGVLIVRLASNATTGYQWRGGKPDSACLKPVGKPTYEPPNTQMPGAGGTQVFAYNAVKPGTVRLSFEYVRPWEKKPVKTYSVSVVIDAGNDPVLLHDGLKNVEYVSEFVQSGKVCLVEGIYSENATPRSPCRI